MRHFKSFWIYTRGSDRLIMLMFVIAMMVFCSLFMGCDRTTAFDAGVYSGPDFDQPRLENVTWTRRKGYLLTDSTIVFAQSYLELEDGQWTVSVPSGPLMWVGTYRMEKNKIEFDMEIACKKPGSYAFRFNVEYDQVQFLYQEDWCNDRQLFIEGNWWELK